MCSEWPLHSKWLNEMSNESPSNFALSLNILHGNCSGDLEGCSYGQLVIGSFITTMHPLMTHISCRVFFLTKHQVARVTQPPYSPDLVPFNFWLFPKLKSPLKGKRFQSINEIQENTTGLMVIGRTVWGLLCRGLRSHYPMYNVSCILFKNCLYCSYYVAGYLLDRSRTYVPKYLQFKWNIYRHYPT